MQARTLYYATAKNYTALPLALFSAPAVAISYERPNCLGMWVADSPEKAEADRKAMGTGPKDLDDLAAPANVYTLSVEAAENGLLRWDQPINAQGPALRRLAGCNGPEAKDLYSRMTGEDFYTRLFNRCQTPNAGCEEYEERMGSGDHVPTAAAYVVDKLCKAGFVGVRFPERTLLFDPASVTPTHKNGIALPESRPTRVAGRHEVYMGLAYPVDSVEGEMVCASQLGDNWVWTFDENRERAVRQGKIARQQQARQMGFSNEPGLAAVAKVLLTLKSPMVFSTGSDVPAKWFEHEPVRANSLMDFAVERGHDGLILVSAWHPDENFYVPAGRKNIKTLEVVRNRAQRIETDAFLGTATPPNVEDGLIAGDVVLPLHIAAHEAQQCADAERSESGLDGSGTVTPVKVVLRDPMIVKEALREPRAKYDDADFETAVAEDHDSLVYQRADGSYSLLVAFELDSVLAVSQDALTETGQREAAATEVYLDRNTGESPANPVVAI